LTQDDLLKRIGQTASDVMAALAGLLDGGTARLIGRNLLVDRGAVEDAGSRMAVILIDHQKRQPLSWGLSKSELKSRLERQVHPDLIDVWIQEREAAGELFIRDDRLRFGEAVLTLSPVHAALRDRILAEVERRGFSAPTMKELLESIGSPSGAEEILVHLHREGEIVKIPPDLLFGAKRIAEMGARIRDHFSRHQEMGVAALKELLGVSRKQAVPLLEWMDRQRWTERRGDVRVAGKQLGEGVV
jgi:selenocysteine-specific elongation factor